MYNKLTVTHSGVSVTCFLLDGFYDPSVKKSPFHRHYYTEIHLITGGTASYQVDDRTIDLCDNNTLAIPGGHWHNNLRHDPTVRHAAFCIDYPLESVVVCKVNTELIDLFLDAIGRCATSRQYQEIQPYLSLVLFHLLPQSPLPATPIGDPAFIIDRFFSLNYHRQARLTELAQILRLSEKQTGRLVQKYTGRPFTQAMVAYRLSAAQHLRKTTDMSLADIAAAVGYQSYNGFLKAYKAQGDETKCP